MSENISLKIYSHCPLSILIIYPRSVAKTLKKYFTGDLHRKNASGLLNDRMCGETIAWWLTFRVFDRTFKIERSKDSVVLDCSLDRVGFP